MGDLDGDGDLDAFVTNDGAREAVYRNDGTGMFSLLQVINVSPKEMRGIELGDVDGDGDLDAVIANRIGGNIVLVNNGNGQFTDSGQRLGNRETYDVGLADFDADGDLDFIAVNSLTFYNMLWVNNGSGQFTSANQPLGTNSSRSVAVGDLDGDGDIDAYVANAGTDSDSILKNGRLGDLKINVTEHNATAFAGERYTYTLIVENLGVHAQDTRVTDSISELLSGATWTAQVSGGANAKLFGSGDLNELVTLPRGAKVIYSIQGIIPEEYQGIVSHKARAYSPGINDVTPGNNFVVGSVLVEPDFTTGTGLFEDGEQWLGYLSGWDVIMTDIDNDGDEDAFVIGDDPNPIWLNNGLGEFTQQIEEIALFDFTKSSARQTTGGFADLNNDGLLDLILGDNNIRVYFNQGGTDFKLVQTLAHPESFAFIGVELSDLDGDGDVDIFSATTEETQVWKNNGTGAFVLTNQVAIVDVVNPNSAPTRYTEVHLADFDNDGDVDAFLPEYQRNRLLLNDGTGVFVEPVEYRNFNNDYFNSTLFKVGDYDSDGDTDIILARFNSDFIVYENNGGLDFSFLRLENTSFYDYSFTDLDLFDADNDGDLDILLAINNSIILLNQGNRIYAAVEYEEFSQSPDRGYYGIADLDGDGRQDLFLTTDDGNLVYFNEGEGKFSISAQALYPSRRYYDRTYDVSVGDVDGDGDIDAFTVSYQAEQPAVLWINDGTGRYTQQPIGVDIAYFYNDGRNSLMVDIDGDHDLDLVVIGANGSFYIANEGNGTFAEPAFINVFSSPNSPYAITMADFNGDNLVDFYASTSSGYSLIYINEGNVQFRTTQQRLVQGGGVAAAGDFDGDGDIDLYSPYYYYPNDENTNSFFFNDGRGNFTPGGSLDTALAAKAGDLDGDGDLDLFVANHNGKSGFTTLINDGHGNFSAQSNVSHPGITFSYELIDVDADGDLDAVSRTGTAITTFLNNGHGVFNALQSIPNANGFGFAAGDLNNDGSVDLFVSNFLSAHRVLFNGKLPWPLEFTFENGHTTGLDFNNPRNISVVEIAGNKKLELNNSGLTGLRTAVGELRTPLPAKFEMSAEINTLSGTDRWQNGFLIFDYKSPTDFKYAGFYTGQNQWVIGHYDGNFNHDKMIDWDDSGRDIKPDVAYTLLLSVDTNRVVLKVNGEFLMAHSFNQAFSSQSQIGLASINAVTQFDNFYANDVVPLVNDLTIDKSSTPTIVSPGQSINYVIMVRNEGTYTVSNARVQDKLTSNLTNISWTATTSAGVTATRSGTGDLNQVVSLPAGGWIRYAVNGKLKTDLKVNHSSGASVSSVSFTDPRPQNNVDADYDFLVVKSKQGNGYFEIDEETGLPINTLKYVFGDFDGDGDQDALIVPLSSSAENSLWENDGTGFFSFHSNISPQMVGVFTADLDGDGDLDLQLTSNSGTKTLLNDGDANFTETTFPGLLNISFSAFEDVNMDGHPDAVVISGNGFYFLFNSGYGEFLEKSPVYTAGASLSDIHFGDLDGDGDTDLVYRSTYNYNVWKNDGRGIYSLAESHDLNNISLSTLDLGDVDQDGDLDLVLSSNITGTGGFYVLLNDGSGSYFSSLSSTPTGIGEIFQSLALGDLDADGDLDLFTTHYSTNYYAKVWLNDGKGTFTSSSEKYLDSTRRYSYDPVVIDLDNDGDLDVLFRGYSYSDKPILLKGEKGRAFPYVQTFNDNNWKGLILSSPQHFQLVDTSRRSCLPDRQFRQYRAEHRTRPGFRSTSLCFRTFGQYESNPRPQSVAGWLCHL
ncbi:MAG: FG-GAP-like repeat-containing protein [Planctomycetaceae bacterium]